MKLVGQSGDFCYMMRDVDTCRLRLHDTDICGNAVDFPTLHGAMRTLIKQVKKLAGAKARHSGQEEEESLRHAFTSLSILIMKGNSVILSNRIPNFSSSHIDGIQQ